MPLYPWSGLFPLFTTPLSVYGQAMIYQYIISSDLSDNDGNPRRICVFERAAQPTE